MIVRLRAVTILRSGFAAAFIMLVAVLLTGTADADTISLTGTIRDFKDSHVDFEGLIGGLETGLVEVALGGDKKPVRSASASPQTSFAPTFDEWYRDTAGVNLKMPLAITLDNTITGDPTVYTFTDSSFFPIDGMLFGNQGRGHNYHFTYELHTTFTYTGGETFSFTGDDDLWVFLDDKLEVDLGGVHGPELGSVALDTLGLTIGSTYDFDLFFAERHTSASTFRIDTSIALVPTSAVPLPSAAWLALPLLGALGLVRRIRRRN